MFRPLVLPLVHLVQAGVDRLVAKLDPPEPTVYPFVTSQRMGDNTWGVSVYDRNGLVAFASNRTLSSALVSAGAAFMRIRPLP